MGKKKKVTYNYSSEQDAQQVRYTCIMQTALSLCCWTTAFRHNRHLQ
jgi:hypothetical protein